MTPNDHILGDPRRRTGEWVYTARCACGIDIYGATLPRLWAAHDMHLGGGAGDEPGTTPITEERTMTGMRALATAIVTTLTDGRTRRREVRTLDDLLREVEK